MVRLVSPGEGCLPVQMHHHIRGADLQLVGWLIGCVCMEDQLICSSNSPLLRYKILMSFYNEKYHHVEDQILGYCAVFP